MWIYVQHRRIQGAEAAETPPIMAVPPPQKKEDKKEKGEKKKKETRRKMKANEIRLWIIRKLLGYVKIEISFALRAGIGCWVR